MPKVEIRIEIGIAFVFRQGIKIVIAPVRHVRRRTVISQIRCARRIGHNLFHNVGRRIDNVGVPIPVGGFIDAIVNLLQIHEGHNVSRVFKVSCKHLTQLMVSQRSAKNVVLEEIFAGGENGKSKVREDSDTRLKLGRGIDRFVIGVVSGPVSIHILKDTEGTDRIRAVVGTDDEGTKRRVNIVFSGNLDNRIEFLRILSRFRHVRGHDHIGEDRNRKHRHQPQNQEQHDAGTAGFILTFHNKTPCKISCITSEAFLRLRRAQLRNMFSRPFSRPR